jgi:nucleoside-diphosphate-sugar epimerase
MARRLVCLGYGYVAQSLARTLGKGWQTQGTHRDRPLCFDGATVSDELQGALAGADGVLCSIPPDDGGDPALRLLAGALPAGAWLGYLSTTGVYGDRAGGWAFEDDLATPSGPVPARRVIAERQWRAHGAHVFRLPGIYGPGRSAFDRLRGGEAQRVVKPGLVFSRAHVDDIARALAASIARPNPGRIYNIVDDEPAPPQDVTAHAAMLLGIAPPPEIAFADARLSPQAARFYEDSKRVSNARAKAELGWRPLYPSYREGLAAILAAEERGYKE